MKQIRKILCWASFLSLPFFAANCRWPGDPIVDKRLGWIPVYSKSFLDAIRIESPRTISSSGKIFVRGQYLLVNDVRLGVHIIDNSDPRSPSSVAFLKIPGNLDVAVKGNTLFADFQNGIVSIDITNPTEAKILGYLPNVLSPDRIKPPIDDSAMYYYYQCPDTTLGVVVGWRLDSVDMNLCHGNIQ